MQRSKQRDAYENFQIRNQSKCKREELVCFTIKNGREQFLKENMGKEKKEGDEIKENKYMKLVEEEKDLFRIPKHLDTDLLRKKMLFGRRAEAVPEAKGNQATIE